MHLAIKKRAGKNLKSGVRIDAALSQQGKDLAHALKCQSGQNIAAEFHKVRGSSIVSERKQALPKPL